MQVIERALDEVDTLLILIGSAQESNTKRNPFSFEDRKLMVSESLSETFSGENIIIKPLLDCYSDLDWLNQIKSAISELSSQKQSICIYGAHKDDTTWYFYWVANQLKANYVDLSASANICATDIRANLSDPDYVKARVPLPVYNFLYKR
jgi:bifunctional NMN adenylyltransferase/nudix hydrolase